MRTAFLLFAAAAVVRVGVLIRSDTIFNDGPTFLSMAEAIEDGRWADVISTQQHPGYPILIRLAMFLFDSSYDAAIAVSIASGSLAVVGLYSLLVQMYSAQVALTGALLLAIHPYAARFTSDVQSEGPYLACFLFAVSALFRAVERCSLPGALLAGLLSGLAYTIRPEGLGVLAGGVLLCLSRFRSGHWSGWHALGWVASLATGASISAAPYAAALATLTGEITVSTKKSLLALMDLQSRSPSASTAGDGTLDGLADPILVGIVLVIGIFFVLRRRQSAGSATEGSLDYRVAWAVLAVGLVGIVALAGGTLSTLSATLVSTLRPEIAALVVLGAIDSYRRESTRRVGFLLACMVPHLVAAGFLLIAYGYLSRRHLLPPLTLLFGYAAIGLSWGRDRMGDALIRRGIAARSSRMLASTTIAVVVMTVQLPKTFHAHRADQIAARLAAEWLRDHAKPDSRLASDRSKFGWYAGLEWRTANVEGEIRSLSELRAERVRYLLIDHEDRGSVDQDESRWSRDANHEIVLLHQVSFGGHTAKVYEIEDRALPRSPR